MKYCNTKDLPSQERLRQLFVYDFESGYLSNRINRKNQAAGARSGTIDHRGYRRTYVDGATYAEHRIIWVWVHGSIPPGLYIDHINHLRQDNRIQNLRLVTPQVNNLNALPSIRNKSGYQGVTRISSSGRYQARIKHFGRNKHIGNFDTAIEAFYAYTLARAKTINKLLNGGIYA